ncbi:MutS-related protein [Nocardia inohanensis]|uniref:MutS-related protein n=1 Tax=Nocardia inohanensis TaxID=209246 RepID=UPI00083474B3|nr:hypothetical protein [Nocardia inohanensis]
MSTLWPGGEPVGEPASASSVADLRIDHRIFAADPEDGQAVWLRPVRDVATVRFRHEVFRDLQDEPVRMAFEAFGAGMRSVRKHLAQGRRLEQRDRWQLDAEEVYCRTVAEFGEALRALPIRAHALRRLRERLTEYLEGEWFTNLVRERAEVHAALDRVRYSVQLNGRKVVVDRYRGQADYSETIAAAFARFRPGDAEKPVVVVDPWPDMNEVEEQLIAAVTEQFPEVFERLARHAEQFREFIDPMLARVDAEMRFYLGYSRFVRGLGERGLTFCFPEVTERFEGIVAEGAFDVMLARARHGDPAAVVVRNDIRLDGPERLIVVTGPNQGGKSTFARMVGQLAYLTALGCPVPGTRARMMLPDRVLTHFVHEDDIAEPGGALAQELARMRDILGAVTERSVVILNESFSTTTAADAVSIGGEVVRRIVERGAMGVYVTFLEELAEVGPEVVSMVAGVESDADTTRTFRIERRPPDGLAYATAVAQRHGLTYDAIRERVR